MNEDGTIVFMTGSNQNHIYKNVNRTGYVSVLSVNNSWKTIAVSSDGNVVLAGGDNLYRSTNGGTNWNLVLSNSSSRSCDMSSDGKKMIHTSTANQRVHISTNSGQTWTIAPLPFSLYFVSCASNEDGTKLVCAGSTGQLYTSSNSGINWVSHTIDSGFTKYFNGVAISKNATKIITGDVFGSRGVYVGNASIL
jgi:photosystem II stability/assembly factor-like uncharacterized protein